MKEQKNSIPYRHGDVPIYPIKKLKGEKVQHNGSHVLAWGKKTGHNHTIKVSNVSLIDIYKVSENTWCLDLKDTATLEHLEHKTLIIQPGKYFVGREREIDPFTQVTRQVID